MVDVTNNIMRKYGNQRFVTYKLLAHASGCSVGTIMRYVKLLEDAKIEE